MTEQISDPFAVLHVRLPARHSFHIIRIDQNERVSFFEQVVERTPKNAGTLHCEMSDALCINPITESKNIGSGGPKSAYGLLHTTDGEG